MGSIYTYIIKILIKLYFSGTSTHFGLSLTTSHSYDSFLASYAPSPASGPQSESVLGISMPAHQHQIYYS